MRYFTSFNVLVKQIHALAILLAFNSSVFVGSALIKGYANLKERTALSGVFDEIIENDIVRGIHWFRFK